MKISAFKFSLLCVGMFLQVASFAQSSTIGPPELAIKFSVPHLFYFYPSIQVGLEHKVFKNVNLQYDLGLVLGLHSNESENYQNKKGFRGIVEARYYLPSPPKVPFYVAGEFYYSRINFDRSQVIGYECATGDCSYFEYVTYQVQHNHHGVGMKYGMLLYPGWNRNRSFFFDINGGIAYRTISYHDNGKPVNLNAEFFDNNSSEFFHPKENNHEEFRLILGVRLGYTFH